MAAKTGENLLDQINKLQLSPRLFQLKDAMFSAPRVISVDRGRLAMESWKETEGEEIEIRRAKLFKKVLEGVPIAIHDCDIIAGRETEHLVGAPVFVDETGNSIPGLWNEGESLSRWMVFNGEKAREEKNILRECARFFDGKTAPDHVVETWHAVAGSWADDITEAKGADPTPDSGYFPGITCRGMWEKMLAKGMKGLMEEAKAGLKRFEEMKETDVSKLYFWQSAIIVCEAMVNYAKRYATLAREKAAKEPNPQRKKELEEIAGICERVPENPARTFHEALQSINLLMVGRGLEMMYPVLIGRIDQYLYPYFEKDLKEGRITLERAAELLGGALTLWGMKVVVPTGKTQLETHQFSFCINSINIGGVAGNGKDATNPLSYLVLHMIGLIKLASPTVLLNWNSQTPRPLLLKALETNYKTKGGIPLFENSDHVVNCFVNDGTPVEEAREWYGQGCVTPILPTKIDHNGSEGKGR